MTKALKPTENSQKQNDNTEGKKKHKRAIIDQHAVELVVKAVWTNIDSFTHCIVQ